MSADSKIGLATAIALVVAIIIIFHPDTKQDKLNVGLMILYVAHFATVMRIRKK